MRYTPAHKETTRRRILQEAEHMLRLHGPDGVGLTEVMRRAGLTHGGFYVHFKSRDALVKAVITDMFARTSAHFERVTAGKPRAQAVADYVDSYLSMEHRSALTVGCPLAALLGDMGRLRPAAREVFGHGLAAVHNCAVKLLGDDAQARSFVAELLGALMVARAVPRSKQADDILQHSREQLKARFIPGDLHEG